MKQILLIIGAVVALAVTQARALNIDDIAGIYQGNSTAYLPNGSTVNASIQATVKRNGKLKTVAMINGQTIKGTARYSFVSEDSIYQSDANSQALSFIEQDGNNLTLNILVRTNAGQIIREVTTLTLVKKL